MNNPAPQIELTQPTPLLKSDGALRAGSVHQNPCFKTDSGERRYIVHGRPVRSQLVNGERRETRVCLNRPFGDNAKRGFNAQFHT